MSAPAGSRIRLLLIDDHAMLRQGLSLVLGLQPDLAVVGEAGSGADGIKQAAALQPDVVLLDLNMPDMDGIEVMQRLRRATPVSKVLILSGIHADARVYATVEAGVDGYIVKDASTEELVTAIRAVAAGDAYFHPMITRALTSFLRGPAQPAAAQPRLTPRELEVLQHIATSATNRDIAARMQVSEETVRSHVKNILRKLDQPTRTQAVLEGVRLRLVSVE